MKLIIGGYAQGKLNYTVTKYNVAEDHVFESVLPSSEEAEKLEGTVIVSSLHKWIKKRIKEFIKFSA